MELEKKHVHKAETWKDMPSLKKIKLNWIKIGYALEKTAHQFREKFVSTLVEGNFQSSGYLGFLL